MPENPTSRTASEENNISGPDYFGFYTNELKGLLSQNDSLLPYAHQVSSSSGNLLKGTTKSNCQIKENSDVIGSASLFSNEIGAMLSESKKQRLKSLLRQSVVTLTKEVDEMINPVLSVCRIRSCLKCKESLLKNPERNPKASSNCSSKGKARNAKNVSSDVKGGEDDVEIDDDLRLILENDSNKVEELMKSHTDEISATLHHMEQNLEELLNIVMTTCRAMTIAEKQQLMKLIHNLPSRNLDRVAEIIQLNKPPEPNSSNKLRIDLNELDNVTLWRLYFFVATIKATSSKCE